MIKYFFFSIFALSLFFTSLTYSQFSIIKKNIYSFGVGYLLGDGSEMNPKLGDGIYKHGLHLFVNITKPIGKWTSLRGEAQFGYLPFKDDYSVYVKGDDSFILGIRGDFTFWGSYYKTDFSSFFQECYIGLGGYIINKGKIQNSYYNKTTINQSETKLTYGFGFGYNAGFRVNENTAITLGFQTNWISFDNKFTQCAPFRLAITLLPKE